MKFKCINSSADIKKMIKVDTITQAPLDNKNVMTDWIDENLFDEGNCTYNDKHDTYVGFINGIATYLRNMGNHMMVKPVFGINPTTDADILNKFTELLNGNVGDDYLTDSELISVCETDRQKGYYFISFFFGRYIGK